MRFFRLVPSRESCLHVFWLTNRYKFLRLRNAQTHSFPQVSVLSSLLNRNRFDFVKFDLSNKLHHIRLLRKVKLISSLLTETSLVMTITRLITSTFVNESPFSEAVEVKTISYVS
ncbi:MAG: hypothetical protein ACTS7I_01435 [Candidatus Hodgkinia cicadicola]